MHEEMINMSIVLVNVFANDDYVMSRVDLWLKWNLKNKYEISL